MRAQNYIINKVENKINFKWFFLNIILYAIDVSV